MPQSMPTKFAFIDPIAQAGVRQPSWHGARYMCAYFLGVRIPGKIGDVDDVERQLRREVAKLRTGRARVEELVKKARAQEPDPIPYAILEEITGWTREFLRRVANGEPATDKPRRLRPPRS